MHNIEYIHKTVNVDHNYDNDPEWNQKWENFFNIRSISSSSLLSERDIQYISHLDFALMDEIKNIIYL